MNATVIHNFVDEAGTPTLFARRQRIIVGDEGCSNFFLLGTVTVEDPVAVGLSLENLRRELLADPYFRGGPSMLLKAKKTALAFHAKDDLPEIRREVFRLLPKLAIRFRAVVRDKMRLVEEVQARNERDAAFRYSESAIYDSMVTTLFENHFHRGDHFAVTFAKRGAKPRTHALRTALEQAREKRVSATGTPANARLDITPSTPELCVPLQVIDYFLWALRRFYEQREDRFLELVWAQTDLVHDIDEGGKYTPCQPLKLAGRFGRRELKVGRRI